MTMRRNPYTGHLMNTSPCLPCRRELKKRGRRRQHRCAVQTVSPTLVVICDCECRALTTAFTPPRMALS